jgi:hypothetical protein
MFASATVASLLLLAQGRVPLTTTTERLVVSATAGRGSTWDDEGGIGAGWSAGGAVEWRLAPRVSAVLDVERLPHARETPGLQFSGRTVFASAGLKYRVARAGVSPYVEGGIGVARYAGDLLVRFDPPPVTVHRRSTSRAVHAAGGVEIPLGARVVLAPELRLRLCQPQDDFAPWSTLGARVRVGLRF